MAFTRKTTEEKEVSRQESDEAKFLKTVPGHARTAYQRGDALFQCSVDVMGQDAVVVAMVGTSTTQRTADPSDVLNAVSREGWVLVNGSFVFVETGQQSRDKFMSSGQNTAVKGKVVGYYVFRRAQPGGEIR